MPVGLIDLEVWQPWKSFESRIVIQNHGFRRSEARQPIPLLCLFSKYFGEFPIVWFWQRNDLAILVTKRLQPAVSAKGNDRGEENLSTKEVGYINIYTTQVMELARSCLYSDEHFRNLRNAAAGDSLGHLGCNPERWRPPKGWSSEIPKIAAQGES